MSWRYAFVERFGPGGLSGCTFGGWLRILWHNRFAVAPQFWPRAALITINSSLLSVWRLLEHLVYSAQVKRTSIPPPLFVLGVWRSGTTHLHNLLAQDARFAFSNTVQVLYPHTFLLLETWQSRAMQPFMPPTRPMDNVKSGVGEPQEEEFALTASGLSFLLAMLAFPKTGDYYRRFLTLRDATPRERHAWKSAYLWFLRKLTLKHGRPLVLKSPANTARISVLLELFPEAKFVHIHRHPYEVFQSSLHAWRKVNPFWGLQKDLHDEERIIRDYRAVYDAFLEERHLIPARNFCEVAFNQLEDDPIGQMQRIYETLGLGSFDEVEDDLREYLQSIEGYSKNRFPELPSDLRERLAHEWSRCFEEWRYPK